MIKNPICSSMAAMAVLATLSGCVTNPETGNKTISKSVIGGVAGAVGGYLLGDLIGGRRDRTEKIIGAGIGGVAGAGIGYYMDEQERKLREQTAGTGVDVIRDGDNLILDMPADVTFAFDSDTVEPGFRQTLANVGSTLKQYEKTYLDVMGHTDSTGSDAYNQNLSERRAAAVAAVLMSNGVQSARLATKGFGETQLKCPETTEEGRRCNRRVEIRIVPVTQADVN